MRFIPQGWKRLKTNQRVRLGDKAWIGGINSGWFLVDKNVNHVITCYSPTIYIRKITRTPPHHEP